MSFSIDYDGLLGEASYLPFIGTNTSITYFSFWNYGLHDNSLFIDCLRVREGTNYGYTPFPEIDSFTNINSPSSEIIGDQLLSTIFSHSFVFIFAVAVVKRSKFLKRNN